MWVGEFFGLLTALCWALGIFPFTESTRFFKVTSINTFRLLLGSVLLAVLVIIADGLHFAELFTLPAKRHWIWLGASGLVGLALGDFFSFAAFREIGARNSSIFSTLAPGAAIVFGMFLLNEKMNVTGFAGMFITITGVALTGILKPRKEGQIETPHQITLKGSVMAIASALCQGAGLVLAKKAIDTTVIISPFHAAWIRIIVATICLYTIRLFRNDLLEMHREMLGKPGKGLLFVFTGTVLGSVLGISFAMKTVSLVDAAVAQTIFSLVPVFAIPLSYAFYRQPVTWKILLAASLALGGVIVLIWRERIADYFL